jgi:hypothetical protein
MDPVVRLRSATKGTTHMRRLALLLALAAGLVFPGAALAAPTLAGKYTMKITAAGQFKGTWTLTFTKAGGYTVAHAGAVLVTGKYTVSGSKVTLGNEKGPLSCSGSGKYSWKRTGTALRFTKVNDSPAACAGRIYVLSRVFTKAS